jgi:hypothetical protein
MTIIRNERMKNIKMLRKKVRDRIKHEKMLREHDMERKTKLPRERAYYNRIRKAALKDIKELTFLIENLPEKQLEQIFTVKRHKNKEQPTPLAAFLRALFSLESEDPERRRKRVKYLWSWVLGQHSGVTYTINLVGSDVWRIVTSQAPRAIEAIYYATQFME